MSKYAIFLEPSFLAKKEKKKRTTAIRFVSFPGKMYGNGRHGNGLLRRALGMNQQSKKSSLIYDSFFFFFFFFFFTF